MALVVCMTCTSQSLLVARAHNSLEPIVLLKLPAIKDKSCVKNFAVYRNAGKNFCGFEQNSLHIGNEKICENCSRLPNLSCIMLLSSISAAKSRPIVVGVW